VDLQSPPRFAAVVVPNGLIERAERLSRRGLPARAARGRPSGENPGDQSPNAVETVTCAVLAIAWLGVKAT